MKPTCHGDASIKNIENYEVVPELLEEEEAFVEGEHVHCRLILGNGDVVLH